MCWRRVGLSVGPGHGIGGWPTASLQRPPRDHSVHPEPFTKSTTSVSNISEYFRILANISKSKNFPNSESGTSPRWCTCAPPGLADVTNSDRCANFVEEPQEQMTTFAALCGRQVVCQSTPPPFLGLCRAAPQFLCDAALHRRPAGVTPSAPVLRMSSARCCGWWSRRDGRRRSGGWEARHTPRAHSPHVFWDSAAGLSTRKEDRHAYVTPAILGPRQTFA